jgi:hypothetical protein
MLRTGVLDYGYLKALIESPILDYTLNV